MKLGNNLSLPVILTMLYVHTDTVGLRYPWFLHLQFQPTFGGKYLFFESCFYNEDLPVIMSNWEYLKLFYCKWFCMRTFLFWNKHLMIFFLIAKGVYVSILPYNSEVVWTFLFYILRFLWYNEILKEKKSSLCFLYITRNSCLHSIHTVAGIMDNIEIIYVYRRMCVSCIWY